MINFKEMRQFLPGTNPKKRWEYYDIADNLFPPIKHSFLQYAYDKAIPLHDYFNHIRSSQAFAVNLIYPILHKEPEVLLKLNLLKGSLLRVADIRQMATKTNYG